MPERGDETYHGGLLQRCVVGGRRVLAAILERSNLHYEAILGHLEVQFKRQRSLGQEYYGLYLWLVEMVYYLLYYQQVNNEDFFAANLRRYDGIGTLAQQNTPLWVFSLNHDVIIEAIAAHMGDIVEISKRRRNLCPPFR